MALYLLMILIGIPILEIWVFIEIGGRIGVAATIIIVLITGVLGTILLRYQGMGVLQRAQLNVAQGITPVAEIIDGVGLVVAGIVLLTPGFVTDAVGALLFVPAIRRALAGWIFNRLKASAHFTVAGGRPGAKAGRRTGDATTIDGDFSIVDDPNGGDDSEKPNNSASPWTKSD